MDHSPKEVSGIDTLFTNKTTNSMRLVVQTFAMIVDGFLLGVVSLSVAWLPRLSSELQQKEEHHDAWPQSR